MDLFVQESGYQKLKELGIQLIPVDAPDFFNSDDPSRALIRQMFGAVCQFERATVVAKLNSARKAKKETTGKKVEGRKSYAEFNPELVKTVRRIKRRKDKISGKPMSLRKISSALYAEGFTNSNGKELGPPVIRDVLAQKILS